MTKYKAYPAYKDSGVAWLGEIPEGWSTKSLKYVMDLTPKKSELSVSKSQLCSFVPMEKLKTDLLILDEEKVISEVYDGYTYFRDHDILMAKVTPCFENKNIAIANNLKNSIGFGSSEIYVLRTKEQTLNRYLYYRLQENSFMDIMTAAMTGAGGLKRVPSSILNDHIIATPKIAEQTQIANFLDHETARIDTLITKQEALIALLKEKQQAVISHAVTQGLNPDAPMKDSGVEWLGEVPAHWKKASIKNLCYVNDGNHGEEYPSEKDFVQINEGVPFIRAGDFDDFKVVKVNLRYISHEKNSSMRKGGLQENDILFVNRGATIGKVCLIDKGFVGSNLNSQIAYIRSNNKLIDYKFLLYFLASNRLCCMNRNHCGTAMVTGFPSLKKRFSSWQRMNNSAA